MEDEVAHLIEKIESNADALRTLGLELTNAETKPFSGKAAKAFRSEAFALTRQVERTQQAISEFAKRCEAASLPSSEVKALKDVAVEIAGEAGSLAAIVDLVTGELPGWGASNRTATEIGADILRTARDLRRPALHLTRVRAMKSPKRFAVGAAVRLRMPGVDGIVTQLDSSRSTLSEYWHTIETKTGVRREPGCNLELIEPPITHVSTEASKIAETINFHGPNSSSVNYNLTGSNARVNIGSHDHSTNSVTYNDAGLFSELRQAIESVHDQDHRANLLSDLEALRTAQGKPDFGARYAKFISTAADYMSIVGPFLPALAKFFG